MKNLSIATLAIYILLFGSFTKAVSQTSIPAPVGLVSWWSGDGNVLDARSRNVGTLQNGVIFSPGRVGQGFSFDGNNDFITVNNDSSLNFGTNDFSVEFWVYINGTQLLPGKEYGLINKNANYENSPGWGLELSTEFGNFPNPRIAFFETNLTWNTSNVGSIITVNTWHHVAAMRQGGNTNKLYLDGILVASNTGVGISGDTSNGQPLLIGSAAWLGTFFPGQLDEISIYNRALSSNEVQTLYDAGTAGKSKPTATNAPASLVGFWTGDGNANDIIGGNNGTLQNALGFGIGKVGQSFNFDGIDDFIQIPMSSTLDFGTNDFSIELWIRLNSTSGDQTFFHKTVGSFPNSQEYLLESSNGGLRFVIRDTVSNENDLNVPTVISPNIWYHVSAIRQGNNSKIYLNGNLVGNQTVGTNINTGIGNAAVFGKLASAAARFVNGQFDEVSLYSSALTQTEIQSIYHAGAAGKLKQKTTPTGSNVVVNTNSDSTITFPTVSTTGITQQTPLDLSTLPSLPNGSTTTGLSYDISTSALFSGSPTVCFNLPSITNSSVFNNLQLIHLENNVWINRTGTIDFSTRTLCSAGLTSLSPFAVVNGIAPTAAESSISGRVKTANGKGIRNVIVQISGGNLNEPKFARTNPFGYYRINGLVAGETYILTANSKRYFFANPTRVITLVENLDGEDFVSESK